MLLGLREWRRFALAYVYIISLTAAYSIFLPTTRYRLPVDFFLAIFAAMFIDTFIRPQHDRSWLRAPKQKTRAAAALEAQAFDHRAGV